MVSFDASVDGTSVGQWNADARLAAIPRLSLHGVRSLVVVAAHPDDETLGAGGLIAAAAVEKVAVTVLVVTDGAARGSEFAAVRAAEVTAAVAQLAPAARVLQLGFDDGGTREHPAEIRAAMAPHFADVDLVVAPWRGDGHRDHRVVGELVASLAEELGIRLLEYPIWLWHWATPASEEVPWSCLAALDIDGSLKGAAIASFESQLSGDAPMLRPRFLQHFAREREIFVQHGQSLDTGYFDNLYARHDDPWGFESRRYEKRKRDITMATLPLEHYDSVLEIGCSIGMLTEMLAPRSSRLLAVDVSSAAVQKAAARVARFEHARVSLLDVTREFPHEKFDLIVISEVGYYFDAATLAALHDRCADALAPGGTILGCHWRHPVADYPQDGDAVHRALAELPLAQVAGHVEADFLLDVFCADPRSVAQREGLAE
ncbi:MAG: SAM-dependent methyltransferase [Microbacteriaceae bacterium]|nr:SAM-dependent methyltransferase [Microbacteriaceae bacterium]